MSTYQIWVRWSTQDAEHPRQSNEYSLMYETHELEELYNKETAYSSDDSIADFKVTKEVEVIADFSVEEVD